MLQGPTSAPLIERVLVETLGPRFPKKSPMYGTDQRRKSVSQLSPEKPTQQTISLLSTLRWVELTFLTKNETPAIVASSSRAFKDQPSVGSLD